MFGAVEGKFSCVMLRGLAPLHVRADSFARVCRRSIFPEWRRALSSEQPVMNAEAALFLVCSADCPPSRLFLLFASIPTADILSYRDGEPVNIKVQTLVSTETPLQVKSETPLSSLCFQPVECKIFAPELGICCDIAPANDHGLQQQSNTAYMPTRQIVNDPELVICFFCSSIITSSPFAPPRRFRTFPKIWEKPVSLPSALSRFKSCSAEIATETSLGLSCECQEFSQEEESVQCEAKLHACTPTAVLLIIFPWLCVLRLFL